VNRGPEGSAVLARIDALGWDMVLGNHDDLVRMWSERDEALPEAWFASPFWRSTAWCSEELAHAGWMPHLARLPRTVAFEPPDAPSVLVSHGSPRHYREGYGEQLADEAISEIVQMHPYDVLVGSHTHIPMERRWGGHLVVNSGAVGSPFNDDVRAQYVVLHRSSDGWRPEFRAVAYDRRAAVEAYTATGYLEAAGLSAAVYRLELATGRSVLVPFMMFAEKADLPLDEVSWERYVRECKVHLPVPDEAAELVMDDRQWFTSC